MPRPLTTDAERTAVDIVARYSMIDVAAASAMITQNDRLARRLLQTLTGKRWLNRWPFGERRSYYTLSRGACGRLRLHHSQSTWLGYRPRVRAYGTLWFCHRAGQDLLSPAEWTSLCPTLHRPGLPAHSYYFDDTADRIGWVHVDLGGPIRNLERRLAKIADQRVELFAALIEAGRFQIDLVVASPGRADVVRGVEPCGIPAAVHVVPELAHVLLNPNPE